MPQQQAALHDLVRLTIPLSTQLTFRGVCIYAHMYDYWCGLDSDKPAGGRESDWQSLGVWVRGVLQLTPPANGMRMRFNSAQRSFRAADAIIYAAAVGTWCGRHQAMLPEPKGM